MRSALFSPISLRELTLDNRIVVSPMCQYSARDGSATDWHLMHLGQFCVAGPGLVMVEATGVEARGRISYGVSPGQRRLKPAATGSKAHEQLLTAHCLRLTP